VFIVVSASVIEACGVLDVAPVVPTTGASSEAGSGAGALGAELESVGSMEPSDSAEVRILCHSVWGSEEGSVSDHVSDVNSDPV